MLQVRELLKKLGDINELGTKTAIDIDLMLEHTRNLYALLLEQRNGNGHYATPANEIPDSTAKATKEYTAPTIELDNKAETPQPATEIKTQTREVPRTNSYAQPAFSNDYPLGDENEEKEQVKVTPPPAPIAEKEPAKDIRKSIGINDKYQIMSELFGNDKDSYDAVLAELNVFHNYAEAHTWLRAHLANNPTWDEESYTVQLLYGLMQRFFAEHRSF